MTEPILFVLLAIGVLVVTFQVYLIISVILECQKFHREIYADHIAYRRRTLAGLKPGQPCPPPIRMCTGRYDLPVDPRLYLPPEDPWLPEYIRKYEEVMS